MTLASYITEVLADTPWGFWQMQETSGTSMADSSGNSHGGLYDATVVPTSGPYSGFSAAHFTGTTASIAGVYASNSPMAFELWAKLTSSGNPQCVLFDYVNGANTQGFETGAMKVSTCGPNLSFATNSPSMGWTCSAHPDVYDTIWSHVVFQLESDGHWRMYARTLTGSRVVDDLGAHALNLPTTPGLYIGRRPDGTLPFLGDVCCVAFYTHALSATRIEAHFTAAASTGPPPPPCQYGTRKIAGQPVSTIVTDALVTALLVGTDQEWLIPILIPLLGTTLNVDQLCQTLPPPVPTLDPSVVFQTYRYTFPILANVVWNLFCECTPGATTPTPNPPYTPARPAGTPDNITYVINPTNPCYDFPEVRRKLDEILRIVGVDLKTDTLMQRYSTPFATIRGATHSGLAGYGSFAISDLIGVQITITSRNPGRELEGAPQYVWDLGWASCMDGNGFIQERRITRDVEVWMPRNFQEATTFGYMFKEGVVASVTELEAEP